MAAGAIGKPFSGAAHNNNHDKNVPIRLLQAANDSSVTEFHSTIAELMEEEGIRGAAYAFRGPVSCYCILAVYFYACMLAFLFACASTSFA